MKCWIFCLPAARSYSSTRSTLLTVKCVGDVATLTSQRKGNLFLSLMLVSCNSCVSLPIASLTVETHCLYFMLLIMQTVQPHNGSPYVTNSITCDWKHDVQQVFALYISPYCAKQSSPMAVDLRTLCI